MHKKLCIVHIFLCILIKSRLSGKRIPRPEEGQKILPGKHFLARQFPEFAVGLKLGFVKKLVCCCLIRKAGILVRITDGAKTEKIESTMDKMHKKMCICTFFCAFGEKATCFKVVVKRVN